MGHRRFLTGLLLFSLLGLSSSGSGGFWPSGSFPELGKNDAQVAKRVQRSDNLVSTRVRGLGFDIGPISREDGTYLVPVTGFRSREKVLRLEGPFRPFTLRATVDGRQVVLAKEDLDAAGVIVADAAALQALGVRIEPIGASGPGAPQAGRITKTRPPSASVSAKDRTQAQRLDEARRLGPIRWSSAAMAPRNPARKNPPPPLGTVVSIQQAERRIEFDRSLFRVNSRAALAQLAIPVLDPGKKDPTPLADPKQLLPPLPNGRSMTAEDYYRELNLLEKDFNALGYSLDLRRDTSEDIVLQEIPSPSGMNGTGVKNDVATLMRVRSHRAGFQSALKTKQARLLELGKPRAKSPERTPPKVKEKATAQRAQPGARPELKTEGQESLEDRLSEAKKVRRPLVNPYKKELNPTIVEKGDRDTFAIGLEASSRQEGSFEALRVVNGIGVHGYLFGNDLNLISVTGTTYAPSAGGQMAAELAFMVLGNNIPGASLSDTRAVPEAPLSETAALPSVGGEANWSTSLDVSYGMTFMAGPIPLSVRFGARATVGLEYTLLANPIRVENEIRPYANADIYAQAGINLLIVEAGVECELNLMDTSLAVHGMLERGAEDGRDLLNIEYFIHRHYSALSGAFNVYAYVYIPKWALPPWTRKKYTSRICGWEGYSDDLWEPKLTTRRHYLLTYDGRAIVVAGYNY